MAEALPQSEVVSLWNELLEIGRDDGEPLRRANIRLWALCGKPQFSGNPVLWLARARGLLLSGDRSQAMEWLARLDSQYQELPFEVQLAYFNLLLHVGDLDSAKRAAEQLLEEVDFWSTPERRNMAIAYAVRSGNVALLSDISSRFGLERGRDVLYHLNEAKLAPCFSEYMKCVERAAAQESSYFNIHVDGDVGCGGITLRYYMNCSFSERDALHEKLYGELSLICSGNSVVQVGGGRNPMDAVVVIFSGPYVTIQRR